MGLNGIEYFILFSYELKYELIFALSPFATTQKRMPEEKINGMTVRLLKEERCKKTEVYNRDGVAGEFTDGEGRLHKGVLKIKATCANAEVFHPVDVDIIHDRCKVIGTSLVASSLSEPATRAHGIFAC